MKLSGKSENYQGISFYELAGNPSRVFFVDIRISLAITWPYMKECNSEKVFCCDFYKFIFWKTNKLHNIILQ